MVKIKTIPLSQGKFALVDDEDFEELSKHKWHAVKDYNTYYARRRIKGINGKAITMHQQLLGKKEGLEIDHDDGNGLNNQRYNLKHVTHRQNMLNRHSGISDKQSKHQWLVWHKDRKKWQARIKINGKLKFLGYYSDEYEAFKAYCNAEISLAYSHTSNITSITGTRICPSEQPRSR